MYKIAFAAVAAALTFSATAVEINVASEPALPAANLLKNASFEDGKTAPWRLNGGNSALDTENKFSGSAAIKITGDPAKRPNVAQSFPVNNIKAGDPLYVRFAAKNSGCDIDKKPASIAWQAILANGKRPYLPTLSLPREDYDWTTFGTRSSLPICRNRVLSSHPRRPFTPILTAGDVRILSSSAQLPSGSAPLQASRMMPLRLASP